MTGTHSRPHDISSFFVHVKTSFRNTFDTRVSEWFCAIVLLLWSIILHLNTTLFQEGASYAKLAEIMPQRSWALFCLSAAGMRLIVLLINGMISQSPHLRCFAAFVSLFFWFQISLGFILVGTWGTGLAVYPPLVALDIYHAIRCARLARAADSH